jgi:Tfp pilus assembly pilus retraction ATPase PilT
VPENMKENSENEKIIWNHFARVATYELMLNNTAIANTIRKWDFKQIPSLIQTAKGDGMMEMGEYEKMIGL